MLGGRMVWVEMSRARFVGGRNVKVPFVRVAVPRRCSARRVRKSASALKLALGMSFALLELRYSLSKRCPMPAPAY